MGAARCPRCNRFCSTQHRCPTSGELRQMQATASRPQTRRCCRGIRDPRVVQRAYLDEDLTGLTHCERIAVVLKCVDTGLSEREIALILGLHIRQVSRYKRQARRSTAAERPEFVEKKPFKCRDCGRSCRPLGVSKANWPDKNTFAGAAGGRCTTCYARDKRARGGLRERARQAKNPAPASTQKRQKSAKNGGGELDTLTLPSTSRTPRVSRAEVAAVVFSAHRRGYRGAELKEIALCLGADTIVAMPGAPDGAEENWGEPSRGLPRKSAGVASGNADADALESLYR